MKKIKLILGLSAALIAFYLLFAAANSIISRKLYKKNSEKMLLDGAVLQKNRKTKIREAFDYVTREVGRTHALKYDLKLLEQVSAAKSRFDEIPIILDSLRSQIIPLPLTNYVYVPSEVFEGLENAASMHSTLMDTLYMDANNENKRKPSDSSSSVLSFDLPNKTILSKEALDLIFLRSQTEMETGWIWYADQMVKRVYVHCGFYRDNPIMWPDKNFVASGDSIGFTFLMAEKNFTHIGGGSWDIKLNTPTQYDSLDVLPDNRFVFTASADTFDRHGLAQKTARVRAVFTDMFGDETEVISECDYWVEKK